MIGSPVIGSPAPARAAPDPPDPPAVLFPPLLIQVISGCLYAAKWLKDNVALGSAGTFEQQLRAVRTLQQLLALAAAMSAGTASDASRLAKLRGTP